MSKAKKAQSEPSTYENLVPPKYHHAAALAILLLMIVFFFRDVIFEGKIFLSPDFIAPHSFSTLMEDARKDGIFPLWNPYIFCGMPAYGSLTITGDRFFDITSMILEGITKAASFLFLDAQYAWAFFYYFLMGVGVYLLVLRKVKGKLPALLAAISTVFSMYIIIWVMIGHGTKVGTMAFFPLMLLLIDRLRERWSFLDVALLAIALHFSFSAGHVQMIFYIFLTLGVYLSFFFIRDIVTKSEMWKGTVRAGVSFAAASLIAFAMVSDKYLSVLEYNPYSIRGSSPITSVAASDGQRSDGGLDYEYATNWSFSPGEMITFFVPSWYGFGWNIYQGPLSNNQAVRVNTYFGQMPFTDAPHYMGIVVVVFAIIGFTRRRKEPFVQFGAILIALSLLISFGREFSFLYDLMFNYFPFFNRFRAPSMILILVQFMVPILAAYGVQSLLDDAHNNPSAQTMKRWRYSLIGLAAFTFIGLVGRGFLASVYGFFMSPQETTRLIGTRIGNTQVATELYRFVSNAVATDVLFASFFLLISFGAMYLYFRRMLKFHLLAGILVFVVVADLWRVTTQPMELNEQRQQEQLFTTPSFVKYLQTDSTLFRVLEFENGQPPYSNTLAYWRIQSAYGYQGAKMRAYQDMIDVAGIHNPLLWQLMNVKYIVTNRPDSASFLGLAYDGPDRKVYVNRLVYPRAFFVNRYEVASGLEVLNKIAARSFNPRDVAYFLHDPKLQLDLSPPINTVEWIRYGIQDFALKVTAAGNNLLFLSEAYYPEGWKAFLDGNEIPIHRTNYMFRGVVIPSGTHTLEMKFEPRGFYVGKIISLISNILLLGGMLAYVLMRRGKQLFAERQSLSPKPPTNQTTS